MLLAHRVIIYMLLAHRVIIYMLLAHRVIIHMLLAHRVIIYMLSSHRVIVYMLFAHRVIIHMLLAHRVIIYMLLIGPPCKYLHVIGPRYFGWITKTCIDSSIQNYTILISFVLVWFRSERFSRTSPVWDVCDISNPVDHAGDLGEHGKFRIYPWGWNSPNRFQSTFQRHPCMLTALRCHPETYSL